MELGELHRTIHGRTAEREVASGRDVPQDEKNTDVTRCQTSDLAHPGLDLVSCSDAAVLAAERGEEEAVLAWLEGSGRVNATYERGSVSGLTLLMGAAFCGHERVVELLLRHGAEVNGKPRRASTETERIPTLEGIFGVSRMIA